MVVSTRTIVSEANPSPYGLTMPTQGLTKFRRSCRVHGFENSSRMSVGVQYISRPFAPLLS